ncbi:type IX secretion system motor protein PorL/GldL [Segatella paludivivens]|uniref:type IX secretion system motor protein PorL/GldL n=1 Tax=Segatella paludivivens TaxID=185294 RepID=UPI0003692247|nr:gliding motility protein GldL [Segatella paludivivens]
MTEYSKYNIVYRLQKWMDSVPGQTFLNYAYSWGASIVVLGALFKLTHLPGANIMLFLGMGTEVLVFFISAFDRPFDKTTDGMDLPTHVTEEYLEGQTEQSKQTQPVNPQPIKPQMVQSQVSFADNVPVMPAKSTIVMPSANPEMEEAQNNYVTELKKLTEVLGKVGDQSSRLARDSEEMENLNRTLTGISKVYEMQLKSASQQIGTIDQINEQSKLLAKHIEQLNGIYTRMIEAMTINMRAAAPTQNTQL